MMVRLNSVVFIWCLFLGVTHGDAFFGHGPVDYHRTRHNHFYWESHDDLPTGLHYLRHGSQPCQKWCIVTFYNGMFLEQRLDCCKFKEIHGYCPTKTVCSWPLPHFLTTVYQCFHDFSCPHGFKCCEDSCFVHKVCHPLLLEPEEENTAIEEATSETIPTSETIADASAATENLLDTTAETTVATEGLVETIETSSATTATESVPTTTEDVVSAVSTVAETEETENTASTASTTFQVLSTITLLEAVTASSISSVFGSSETEELIFSKGGNEIDFSESTNDSNQLATSTVEYTSEPEASSDKVSTTTILETTQTVTATETNAFATTPVETISNSTTEIIATSTTPNSVSTVLFNDDEYEGSGSGDSYEVQEPEVSKGPVLYNDDEDFDSITIV